MSRDQVRWRLRSGRWVRVLGQGLAVAGTPSGPEQQLNAASLTWEDGIGCLGTAARAHGLPVTDDGLVHVSTATDRHRLGVLVPHRLDIAKSERTRVGVAALTTRRRTIIDCLGRLSWEEAERLLAWVVSRRQLTADDLEAWLDQHPREWGNAQRRRASTALRSGVASEAERLLHRLLADGGIVGWVGNASLLDAIGVPASADVYFPDVRLVIEVDGRAHHGATRFQRDRTRQNALVAAGCTVLRYTWADLVERPAAVLAQITAMLTSLRA